MRFGLQKLTLLDYPGKLACSVFSCGCNFRCAYCHNPSLVTGNADDLEYSLSDILAFLESRKNCLEGVCITGGEPLLNENVIDLINGIKSMGFYVKLDTNGSRPDLLKKLVADGAVDYVAMDIKNSPEKYSLTCGFSDIGLIEQSVRFLLKGTVEYEFRTTVTGKFHESADFMKIGKWLSGASKYFLQQQAAI